MVIKHCFFRYKKAGRKCIASHNLQMSLRLFCKFKPYQPLRYLSTYQRPYWVANPPPVIYESPHKRTIQGIKMFSISSLGFTSGFLPFLYTMDSGLSEMARMAVCGTALSTSLIATALIHLFTSPYVIRILVPPSTSEINQDTLVQLETLNLFAIRKKTSARLGDLKETGKRDMAPWEIVGANDSKKRFFRID
ncbi:hypothetical protein NEOLI_005052 [Neolecta irregularis DAH-3]|uniref:Transmembrane protein n=1 Tax=Neolecta irregularis (strain DAH-3) TaxID=1198029 RepID=A0A1U7LIX1_NEOID|nr:hypothetical protein NEOLI_005052 [Neolecta irregularis DAH-3]|eukprot:OLL22471.1 hypothetical protein NEOLI_005052 [Neolecta irregularis DAH-3]